MKMTPGPIPKWALVVAAAMIMIGMAFGAYPSLKQLHHPDPNIVCKAGILHLAADCTRLPPR